MVKYKFSDKIGNEKLTPKGIYYQGNIGGGDNAFESQIYRDNIKNEYFGDRLIRINNKKIKEIDIIWQQLQKKKQNVK